MACKTTVVIVLVLALIGLTGCSDDSPVDEQADPGLHPKPETVSKIIHIVFKWPGDELATRQELEIRDKISRTIEERGIGTVKRVGTGMGTMEIVVEMARQEITRREHVRSEIEAIIREIDPDMKAHVR